MWTIPNSISRGSDAVKFCQAFRIDSFDKHRLYNVEKEWINSDRSGEEIKDLNY